MKKIAFMAVTRNGRAIVTGWQLRCGAVVHRRLLGGRFGASDECWTVSDPVSGGAFCNGYGPAGAVARYRDLRKQYGERFAQVLARKRKELARQVAKEVAA